MIVRPGIAIDFTCVFPAMREARHSNARQATTKHPNPMEERFRSPRSHIRTPKAIENHRRFQTRYQDSLVIAAAQRSRPSIDRAVRTCLSVNAGLCENHIMGNITLSLDEATVKRVRRIALERDTTLTAMVRDYLEKVASSDQALREQQARDIRESFAKFSKPMGGTDWKRDELYE